MSSDDSLFDDLDLDSNSEDSPQEAVGDTEGFRNKVDTYFLEYASYVIRDRAIPHLDDGLKPVQRRILWAMRRMDDGKFNKVANVVGSCMQYHPHGDASIQDALVTLTNKRYVIEGQGNFGNMYTGDRAAAPRYIECRLTQMAREELFDDELTEFVPRYDGRDNEPVTLPSRLPLLLLLGAEGIAVGLSCRILPHNFVETLKAQIAILRKRSFELYPDFEKGCLMDVSKYDDGRGSVRLRARIEVKNETTLVIREAPPNSTSESLISSIEDASKKGKIKVRSISDFTSDQIEIEIKLSQGMDAEKTVAALYAFTECEVNVTSRIVVIDGQRPAEMTVSEALRRNTSRLVELLERRLKLLESKLLEELYFKTLVRIFVENRIYKSIEKATSNEQVFRNVHRGFVPFKAELWREITDDDVERLLKVPIRRISLFDIKKHQDEFDKVQQELDAVREDLKDVVKYTVNHLKGLIKKYGSAFPRKTEIAEFQQVDTRSAALKTLKHSYDREKGYMGTKVSGAEFEFPVSPLDKVLIAEEGGTFRLHQVGERDYVGSALVHVGPHDKEAVFVVVYEIKKIAYIKRFAFGGLRMNRDYRFVPEGAKTLYFEPEVGQTLYVKYTKAAGQRIHQQFIDLADLRVKSAKAQGNQISLKKVRLVVDSKPRGWDSVPSNQVRF